MVLSDSDISNLVIGIGIVIGAIQCFAGYRVFKFVLGLLGFFLGAAFAYSLTYTLSEGGQLISVLVGLLGGCIGAALMVVLYLIGIFLIGACLGSILVGGVSSALQTDAHPLLIVIVAVIGGIVALLLQKLMIILSTAFTGSWSVVTGVTHFTGHRPIDLTNLKHYFRSEGTVLYGVLLCWLVLGIVGVIVQYSLRPAQSVRPQPG